MHITRLRVKNFRSIKEIDLPLERTTVLIGPNNAGKTAILEALRIALTRRWGQKGTGFTEYDCHLKGDTDDPKLAPPIEIEVELAERDPGEWGDELKDDLTDIVQLDPVTGRMTILLKVSCSWSEQEESYVPKWQFLGANRAPLTGKSARLVNMSKFFEYIPVFYLDALRDADDEFSSRSQFWGRLLRSVNIPQKLALRSKQVFDRLNRHLLNADPKIGKISSKLEGVTAVSAGDAPGSVNIRLAPLNTWDLLSRAQVVLKTADDSPWLPLTRHGRGVQSLSVMFLFHAFVEELLRELYHAETDPFLALEEPETHLHPQAARMLWTHVCALPGQKIVTTHSPYFVQNVPFRDIRLLRTGPNGTTFNSLARVFDAAIPYVPALEGFVLPRAKKLAYDRSTNRLIISGKMLPSHKKDLLELYATHAQHEAIKLEVERAYKQSQDYVSDDALQDLQEYARRIRGEIFFARRWLLVEGQSEYMLVHAIGEALGYSLDAHGVAVIDCANNGNPESFALLARALSIPWLAVFDNDDAGRGYVNRIKNQGFSQAEVDRRCAVHEHGDLERQLAAQGNCALLREIAGELNVKDAAKLSNDEVVKVCGKKKTRFAAALSTRLAIAPEISNTMPEALVSAINRLRGLE